MSIPEGLKAVNDVITAPNWDMNRLVLAAAECANREHGPLPGFLASAKVIFGAKSCGTAYGMPGEQGYNNELIAWFLGVILCEYTAGILTEKVKDGHCNAHRLPPAYAPCPIMRAEHQRMLETFRDRLKQLLADVEAQVQQGRTYVSPPPAAPAFAGS